ncbi:lysozyme inhibitor LprI family protein [Muriicola sp. Z0-33]|uniref:lysozyme inhibitor LprI family protein n=1 Tax=Muriicola sp. Z0-33 TaxID=2816957 RepID=UPI002238E814|nr:lysozyme inhibitor LprI family protein [Muriicola sp. Z0-33]MCW5518151.1 DUF1311 domain-containing protein [Muriicola sp. Z0-33]
MMRFKFVSFLAMVFLFKLCYAQEHQLDLKFNELYEESRINGSNSALSYELISEALIDDWDLELNRVYKDLMKNLPEEKKLQLKLSQRKWIEFRDLEFKLLNDIDKDAWYPQPKNREMKFIRNRVLDLIDLNERYKPKPINFTEKLIGLWKGKDNCSEGKNKNQWSNEYNIEILVKDGNVYLKGLYFQRDSSILINIADDEFSIGKQNLGTSDDFIIQGYGKIDGEELIINYQVEVLVDLNNKEYITNYCLSKFKK